MSNQIVLRVRCPEGQYRITSKTGDTFGELLLQVSSSLYSQLSKKLDYPVRDLILQTQEGRPLHAQDGYKLRDLPYMKDGAIIKAEFKTLKKKQSHGVGVSDIQYFFYIFRSSFVSSKCNHPPGGKCLNCITNQQQNKKDEEKNDEPRCNHGPGGRCLNCTNYDPKNR